MDVSALQKQEIIALINAKIEQLGSQSAVARACGVSDATISQMRQNAYKTEGDDMWKRIADALKYRFTNEAWQLADTFNSNVILQTLTDAKDGKMWLCISHRAGSGKSAISKNFERRNAAHQVYRLECREWGKRQFLIELAKLVGLDISRKPLSQLDSVIVELTDYFNGRTAAKPLLIIDEADKLKPAAFRALIPLYNECEGQMGCVILGTDNLKKEIQDGVRHNRKGYDEIASRFGRSFVSLLGATQKDVFNIAAKNGIADKKTCAEIFKQCEPRNTLINGINTPIVDDFRRIKRVIQRELIRQNDAV